MLNSDNKALCWVSISMNRMGCVRSRQGGWHMVSRSHIALAFWSSWVRLATDSGLCSSITRWSVVSGFISLPKPPPSCPFSAWLSAHALPCVHSSFPLFLILPLKIRHTSTVPSFEDTQEKLNIWKPFPELSHLWKGPNWGWEPAQEWNSGWNGWTRITRANTYKANLKEFARQRMGIHHGDF